MTTTTIVSILVGVAVAALLVVRQMHAQPVNVQARAQRIPAGDTTSQSLSSGQPRQAGPGEQAQVSRPR